MCAAAAARAGFARLILPVRFFEENHVNAPNDYGMTGLDRFRVIDQITPNDVPTCMVIVGLNRKISLASFAF